MDILLSRHGDTFEPGEPVVYIGAADDPPLAKKGREQAALLADALRTKGVRLDAVYCGPLRRTLDYATLAAERLGLGFKPIVDDRLNELDFGKWSGLTREEAVRRFGEEIFRDWDQRSRWPRGAGWSPSEETVIAEVGAFSRELVAKHPPGSTALVVSSNGRLRYFLALIEGELKRRAAAGDCKVRTGRLCKLTYQRSRFQVACWNVDPLCLP